MATLLMHISKFKQRTAWHELLFKVHNSHFQNLAFRLPWPEIFTKRIRHHMSCELHATMLFLLHLTFVLKSLFFVKQHFKVLFLASVIQKCPFTIYVEIASFWRLQNEISWCKSNHYKCVFTYGKQKAACISTKHYCTDKIQNVIVQIHKHNSEMHKFFIDWYINLCN
jgi:hypothetical protein